MPDRVFAFIVASSQPNSGKTLLARVLVDYLLLCGKKCLVFDTDPAGRKLAGYFPSAIAVDLDRTQGEIALFDRLAEASGQMRVAEVAHARTAKFFDVLHEIGFVAEARGRGIEPVILFIAGNTTEGFRQAQALRTRFPDTLFVLVENEWLGEIEKYTRLSDGYIALKSHDLRLFMPRLEALFAAAIDDRSLSFSEFAREQSVELSRTFRTLAFLSLETREAVRQWLADMFTKIERIERILVFRARQMAERGGEPATGDAEAGEAGE